MEFNQNTHDYSISKWGHNCEIIEVKDRGMSLRLTGWGKGLVNSDYIILKNGEDTTRYQLKKVRYESDPSDMWFADANFSPREAE